MIFQELLSFYTWNEEDLEDGDDIALVYRPAEPVIKLMYVCRRFYYGMVRPACPDEKHVFLSSHTHCTAGSQT